MKEYIKAIDAIVAVTKKDIHALMYDVMGLQYLSKAFASDSICADSSMATIETFSEHIQQTDFIQEIYNKLADIRESQIRLQHLSQ